MQNAVHAFSCSLDVLLLFICEYMIFVSKIVLLLQTGAATNKLGGIWMHCEGKGHFEAVEQHHGTYKQPYIDKQWKEWLSDVGKAPRASKRKSRIQQPVGATLEQAALSEPASTPREPASTPHEPASTPRGPASTPQAAPILANFTTPLSNPASSLATNTGLLAGAIGIGLRGLANPSQRS